MKNTKPGQTRPFEVLQKESSTWPRVVWAEESKTGLRLEIRPSYDVVPMMSQLVTDGQCSCRNIRGLAILEMGQGHVNRNRCCETYGLAISE